MHSALVTSQGRKANESVSDAMIVEPTPQDSTGDRLKQPHIHIRRFKQGTDETTHETALFKYKYLSRTGQRKSLPPILF